MARGRKIGSRDSAQAKANIAAALRGKHHPHKGHPMSASTKAALLAGRLAHPHHLTANQKAAMQAGRRAHRAVK